MTYDDWVSFPEAGDVRNKRQRNARADKITPIPDSILQKAVLATQKETTVLDKHEQQFGGLTSPFGLTTPVGDIDMEKIGQACNNLMDIK